MHKLASLLRAHPAYAPFAAACAKRGRPCYATGLANIHKAQLAAAICESENVPVVLIAPDEPSATRLFEDTVAFLGRERACLYPVREMMLHEAAAVSHEAEHLRLFALDRLLCGEALVVVASAEAALQYAPPQKLLRERTLVLDDAFAGGPEGLVAALFALGYSAAPMVEGPGQYAHRGGIVDFFATGAPSPCRVEFWGDSIDMIAPFSLEDQRRGIPVESVRLSAAVELLPDEGFLPRLAALLAALPASSPARAGLEAELVALENGEPPLSPDRLLPAAYEQPACLFDHLSGARLLVSDPYACQSECRAVAAREAADLKLYLSEGLAFAGCDRWSFGYERLLTAASAGGGLLDTFSRTLPDFALSALFDFGGIQLGAWGGELETLTETLTDLRARGLFAVVLCAALRGAKTLADDLRLRGFSAVLIEDTLPAAPAAGTVYLGEGALSSGLEYPKAGFAILPNRPQPLQRRRAPARRRRRPEEEIRSLSDLSPGDYVVHTDHGIGVFEGVVKKEVGGVAKDYIRIRYAAGDTLFVPVTQLDLVTKYIGRAAEEGGLHLSRIGSGDWQRTKARVKKVAAEMAGELISLYAKRNATPGFAFSPDNDWQNDFEARFPYEETDDQLRCAVEIKEDMEKARPMDRLLCGDVGFGKTEVALRAAFKCVMDGKQCAILVPTTILAGQHFNTLRQRMGGFPVQIELLSRFRSKTQQEDTVKMLADGRCDIVVGTHRLLSKDVKFKDLGLCIIDEEQRFGVAHKEHLKELRTQVDVLTLSATPIPRTLNMAMNGIRDMSLIEEAPADRQPVQTYVLEHDWALVEGAIRRELRRGGQVFYLHNRVDSIESCATKLRSLVPEARVATAHGKMGEDALSAVWNRLVEGEVDVFVCTTIIESGVDVPLCNTLIIENADRLGLSQLYQLRGRVGRSTRRAFAYFTFEPQRVISEVAAKRLEAIREFSAFGSGFRIALRDLEIRGAGNILGAQQHGSMEAVGYEMYLRLLSEAVQEQQGLAPETRVECAVDVQIPAHLPESYISELSQRLDAYRRIAAIQTREDSADVLDELIDRYGAPPPSVQGLLEVALLRGAATRLGIREISQRADRLLFYPARFSTDVAARIASRLKGRVLVSVGAKPYIALSIPAGAGILETMKEGLAAMEETPPEAAPSKAGQLPIKRK